MTRIYVLEVPENDGFVKVAVEDPSITVDKVGPYFRLSAAADIVIDRRATGSRHAVWYSALAGLEDSRVVQQDKDALRVTAR
ncbi:hypothetical protein [Antrihabitans sp. YC2-6]|uniref:hypothetical protein n=1 Tax=Antrihabitans sp. YC2-6 TaxID=2799498 RepID=UPI001F4149F5